MDRQEPSSTLELDRKVRKRTEELNLSRTNIIRGLGRAAPFHDVGEIGVPDYVVLKTGPFVVFEWKEIKKHPKIGADIIGDDPSLLTSTVRTISLSHYERWDGSGYPEGLKTDSIPKVGHIVAMADVFDALTNIRSYRDAWSNDDAIEHIRNESGKLFDPKIVKAFDTALLDILTQQSLYSYLG